MADEKIIFETFTDGSSVPGDKIQSDTPAGWGSVITLHGKKVASGSGHLVGDTIDRAELTAIEKSLIAIEKSGITVDVVKCYIDRQNLVGSWNDQYAKKLDEHRTEWTAVKEPAFIKNDKGDIVLSAKARENLANTKNWQAILNVVNPLQAAYGTVVEFIWMENEHDRNKAKGEQKLHLTNNPKEPEYAASANAEADQLADDAKTGTEVALEIRLVK